MYNRILICSTIIIISSLPSSARAKLRHSPCHKRSTQPGCVDKHHSKETRPYTQKIYKDHGLKDTMSELGRRARGFYLTPYYFHRVGAAASARVMKRASMNAVVLDVKDDWGRILYPSKVPLSKGHQKHLIKDPARAIKTLHENGIYAIARIVSFKDSRLPYKRPDLAVRIGRKGRRLFSAGANWIDAYSAEVQDYLIDIALELEALGFDEIQFDYIRFPKGRITKYATWLHKDERDRSTLIANFLDRADRALQIPISVDVYGLTTLVDGDPRTLGQTVERMAKYAEAISPMMYANGMGSYFKNKTVTERVYNLIHCGLWRTRQKIPGVVLRPFLQSYPNSVESLFGPRFIVKQVEAAEKSGSNGFLFWNATMKNSMAYGTLGRLGNKRLDAMSEDMWRKPRHHPGAWCLKKGNIFGKKRKKKKKAGTTSEPARSTPAKK